VQQHTLKRLGLRSGSYVYIETTALARTLLKCEKVEETGAGYNRTGLSHPVSEVLAIMHKGFQLEIDIPKSRLDVIVEVAAGLADAAKYDIVGDAEMAEQAVEDRIVPTTTQQLSPIGPLGAARHWLHGDRHHRWCAWDGIAG